MIVPITATFEFAPVCEGSTECRVPRVARSNSPIRKCCYFGALRVGECSSEGVAAT